MRVDASVSQMDISCWGCALGILINEIVRIFGCFK